MLGRQVNGFVWIFIIYIFKLVTEFGIHFDLLRFHNNFIEMFIKSNEFLMIIIMKESMLISSE